MARILLSAYACEPGRGSEPGVGWSWANELSRLGHQVSVLTRADNRAAIEREPRPNIEFLYYDLPRWTQRCRKLSAGKSLYYVLWQWFAARYIRKLFPELPFDVVQHVTYVSVRYPSFMGSLGIPFYFGPVAGGEIVPHGLRADFSFGQKSREVVRDFSNALVPLDPMMRGVFNRADKIFVTPDTLALIPRRVRHKCEIEMPVYLTREYLCKAAAIAKRSSHRVLYAGRLIDWKGLDIALYAIHHLKQWNLDVRFTIVGDGPARAKLRKLANKLGISQVVEWAGWVSQSTLEEHYRTASALLFPSLRDAGVTVILEALAHGLPVVCADLGGPGVIVNQHCGRVIATAHKRREQLASDFAEAVREILTTTELHKRLSDGARARARQFDFERLVGSIYTLRCSSLKDDSVRELAESSL